MITFEQMFSRLPLDLQTKLEKTIQDPKYHAEGNVKIHTEMVYNLLLEHNAIDLLVAAIFHDLGKIDTCTVFEKETGIRVQAIGHENYVNKYIDDYTIRDGFKDLVINWDKVFYICKNHMRAHLYTTGKISKRGKREAMEQHEWFEDLMIFSAADSAGRIENGQNQNYCIILCGIAGSGKSTWRKSFVEKHPEWKVVSSDDMRKLVTGDISNISQDKKVWDFCYSNLHDILIAGDNVIFDSTACNVKIQKQIEDIAKEHNAIILYKIFECNSTEAIMRIGNDINNGVDRSHVPNEVVDRMADNFKLAKKRIEEEAFRKNVWIIHERNK